jgi:ribosomal protein L28
VRFGNSISHSEMKTKRRWYPNVFNKRVWSYALNDWVRFKMTARAMKEIDNSGGIDNYIMALDDKSVADSNYVTKMRGLISASLFHSGALTEKRIKRLGYDKTPPPMPEIKEDRVYDLTRALKQSIGSKKDSDLLEGEEDEVAHLQ